MLTEQHVKDALLVTHLLEASHVHHAVLELNHLWMSIHHCVSIVEMDLLLNSGRTADLVIKERCPMNKIKIALDVQLVLSLEMVLIVSLVMPILSQILPNLNAYYASQDFYLKRGSLVNHVLEELNPF